MFEKSKSYRIFFWISFILIGLFVLFPLYWMINTALKPITEVLTPDIWPKHPTLVNFMEVFQNKEILLYFKNSFIVSIVTSILSTFVAAYAAYSFSKYRYKGRISFMLLILVSKMFPYAVLLLSIYVMMQTLGMQDSYAALVVSYITFALPVAVWTLKTYFDEIPDALVEAAKIDGASNFGIIHKIIFPLAIPGLISTAIYSFVWSWNDILYSLTLITSAEKRTLASGLIMTYIGEGNDNWAGMMAASVVVSIPVAIIFIAVQRFFVQGLTAGAVKG
ncbi:MAG TPA: carbohydrate ABC transporter permease [Bacilli bacterium]